MGGKKWGYLIMAVTIAVCLLASCFNFGTTSVVCGVIGGVLLGTRWIFMGIDLHNVEILQEQQAIEKQRLRADEAWRSRLDSYSQSYCEGQSAEGISTENKGCPSVSTCKTPMEQMKVLISPPDQDQEDPVV